MLLPSEKIRLKPGTVLIETVLSGDPLYYLVLIVLLLHTTSVFSHTCQPDLGKITLIDSSDAISARLTTPSHCAKVNS